MKKKLNNIEYHKKYLDYLWHLYVKTFPKACKFNLSKECKEHATDKRIMKVLITEKILWKNKGEYLWTGNLPTVKVAERVVRQIRLSRKKHLITGVQQINGYKKGEFTKGEKLTFIDLLQRGYKYGYISQQMNRQIGLLRRYKNRLKKKGFDVSPKQYEYEKMFKDGNYTEVPGAEHSLIPLPDRPRQLRLLP